MKDVHKALAYVAVGLIGAACIVGYAKAKPIGYAKTPDGALTIVIEDEQKDCPEGLKKAHWVQKDMHLGGCYWERGGIFFFGWDDDDVIAIPAKAFRQGDA